MTTESSDRVLLLPDPDPQRLTDLFLSLAGLSSPSGKERAVADRITAELRSLALDPWEDGAATLVGGEAGNIVCVVPGWGEPALALGAHMDTVHVSAEIEPTLLDGVFRSTTGTILGADDKVAVVALLHATELMLRTGMRFPAYELFFTVAEEVGLKGAKAMQAGTLRSPLAVVLDSSGPVGGITVRAPSQNTIVAVFKGKSAHAGVEPEKGRSAIVAAAKAVAEMSLGRIDQETTANIGLITGGSARNIVPEECRVEGETRSHDEDKLARITAKVLEALQWGAAECGTDLEIDVTQEYRAFALSRERPVVKLCSAAVRAIGLVPRIESAGGGCDANVLNAAGIETANLVTGMEAVHTSDEHVSLDDLVALTRLVMAAILLSSEYESSERSSRG
jgi:tripeptide aminopeptidase